MCLVVDHFFSFHFKCYELSKVGLDLSEHTC